MQALAERFLLATSGVSVALVFDMYMTLSREQREAKKLAEQTLRRSEDIYFKLCCLESSIQAESGKKRPENKRRWWW